MYTVKQLAELAGVSVRTLHYYDEIDLLNPTQVGSNGYRYYDDDALLRLQQVLFYREIGLELMQIKDVLDQPDFDVVAALRSHRRAIQEKMHRLGHLIETVDETIAHLEGEAEMRDKKKLFRAFSDAQQAEYEREARLQYGPELVNESVQRWNNYSEAERQRIMDEGNAIYADISAALEAGKSAAESEVQALFERWHQHLRHFYEPPLELLAGLATLYTTDVRFIANFQKLHPELPDYLAEGIAQYVDDLETAELERMLAEDEAVRRLAE
jgi:DNA-binding transcriptional MerR regulator